MLNLLAHRYKRLDLPSRGLDGYIETELVKFCYETEIEDDWSTFEELQGQVFGKFLSANMKSNTAAYQSKNDQQQVNQPSTLVNDINVTGINVPRANINKSLSGINCCRFCDKDIICAFTTA